MRHHITESRLKLLEKVFKQLIKHLPRAYHNIQLGAVFTRSPSYNTDEGGYAADSTINIGTSYLMKYGKKEIALAEILAHELGHHVLGHMNITDRDITPAEEQDADHFGMFLIEMAGYKREDLIDHFDRYETDRAKRLSKKHIREHGTGHYRVDRLKDQDSYMIELEDA